jgi:hypothetical protein
MKEAFQRLAITLDPVSVFHRGSQHIGVELHGSIQLVRDYLDVVDPLEHYRLPSFR